MDRVMVDSSRSKKSEGGGINNQLELGFSNGDRSPMLLLSVMVVTEMSSGGNLRSIVKRETVTNIFISGFFVMMKAFWDRYSEKGVMP